MTKAKRRSIRVFLFLITSVVLANVLHRVVLPPEPPDPSTYPRAGDVFASQAEGVTLEVLDVENGWLVLRARIQPGAPGPPLHYHQTFEEAFTVQSGTLYLELADGVIQLGPGEKHRVEPGVPHRPHNPTDLEVILAKEKPVMPQSFGACLVQVYHFLDAADGQIGPGLMIRIAALDPICDSTLPAIPAVVRMGIQWLIVPFARVFGYRNYYPELSLHPGT